MDTANGTVVVITAVGRGGDYHGAGESRVRLEFSWRWPFGQRFLSTVPKLVKHDVSRVVGNGFVDGEQ